MNNVYKEYKKQLPKMVSNIEFKKLLGPEVNNKNLKYPDLENINDLNEILTVPKDYRIILILTQGNSGHWTTISVTQNSVLGTLFQDLGIRYIIPIIQFANMPNIKRYSKWPFFSYEIENI